LKNNWLFLKNGKKGKQNILITPLMLVLVGCDTMQELVAVPILVLKMQNLPLRVKVALILHWLMLAPKQKS